MRYESGREVELGDFVRFDIGPEIFVEARVVMIGEDYSHLDIDSEFLGWVQSNSVLQDSEIVVEPASKREEQSSDKYMLTSLCCVEWLDRKRDAAGT